MQTKRLVVKSLLVAIAIAISFPAFADADCKRPDPAGDVPDGSTATRNEMLDAKDRVQQFVQRGEIYLDCMSKQIEETRAEVQSAVTGSEAPDMSNKIRAVRERYRDLVKCSSSLMTSTPRSATSVRVTTDRLARSGQWARADSSPACAIARIDGLA